MKVTTFDIPGLALIEVVRHGDERGWFMEAWQQERYAEAGMTDPFVQDNFCYSRKGVLRGLHAQHPHAQGKLVQVIEGEVFDVAVDLRLGSPTFGRWHGVTLSGTSAMQFYVPPGFVHGYCVTSETALFVYKCTDLYHPETQFCVRWDDPEIGIEWPVGTEPLLSEKDRDAPVLADIPREKLRAFGPAA